MKRYLLLLPLLLACSLTNQAAMQAPPAATVTAQRSHLATVDTPAPPTEQSSVSCTVTASDFLNVRSGPGRFYAAISFYANGETVIVLDQAGDWLETPAGWIHGNYCDG